MSLSATLALWLALALCLPAGAGGNDLPPHLDAHGRAAYQAYQQAADHRAFAIAPGGAWAWHGEMATERMAREAAVQDCQRHTEQRCVLYSVNGREVFDAQAWPRAWGPYLSVRQAAQAPSGIKRGQRFPDLALQSPDGRPVTLSGLRGQVVVLHFWGSWCPPCQREMPDLQKLYASFSKSKDVRFVLLPVRESLADARRWADRQRITMPIYFGGASTVAAGEFRLADGGMLSDRALAKAFPTTFILDKHGVVVFSHVGPVDRWTEYAPFLKDAAARSGQ